jgi:GDP-mannose 6-dehydrogenase
MVPAISIFGLGYVGCVTAACFAHKGHRVVGVDLSLSKVQSIENGQSPILEPGLGELISRHRKACCLHATMDGHSAVINTDISFLCVGSPSLRNGKLDLRAVESVCKEVGAALKEKNTFHLVVLRSTVLPGTTESIVIPTLEQASGKPLGAAFGLCVNPEFMREGTAVRDFLEPTITIIGAAEEEHASILREIYGWAPGRVSEMSFRCAEMLKYLCNAWHALKVTFANEVGTLAKELNVDAETVLDTFCADDKLNLSPAYLKPGFAFGGSCLPKDMRALVYKSKELDLRLPLLEAVVPSNDAHLQRAADLVISTGKKKVGMLGLSFKAHTDDLRESPQVRLVKRLLGEGCQIQIWDDNVSLGRLVGSNRDYIENVIPHIGCLLTDDLSRVLNHAEVVVIGTRGLEKDALTALLRPEQTVIDLVNVERCRRPNGYGSYEGICW